jgi:hypothetical protein
MFPTFLLSLRGRFDAKRGRSISPLLSFLRSSCQTFAPSHHSVLVGMKGLRDRGNCYCSLPPPVPPSPVEQNSSRVRATPAPIRWQHSMTPRLQLGRVQMTGEVDRRWKIVSTGQQIFSRTLFACSNHSDPGSSNLASRRVSCLSSCSPTRSRPAEGNLCA